MNDSDTQFMQVAIELALRGMRNNEGGPFGAVIVKDNVIIGRGNNRVISDNDPTAHAEIMAIREACQHIDSFQLDGCIIYTSCEPCPMCMGAIYWVRLAKVVYGCTRKDAAQIGFDDDFIYKELQVPNRERSIPMESISRDDALCAFVEWEEKQDKTRY
ncbi:MAG TPA: nucleoside deaminase [Candidatus Kryptobacter bacterium]|nr:nucleoside deaminase [Candidatus Kryptobacter bacterium]